MEDEDHYLAPENFSMVEDGVYRSAFPRTKHCKFILTLGLRSVVPLVPEDYPETMATFYENSGVSLLPHGLDGNKWPFKSIDVEKFATILKLILDPSNRPLLIHCNKAKNQFPHLLFHYLCWLNNFSFWIDSDAVRANIELDAWWLVSVRFEDGGFHRSYQSTLCFLIRNLD